MVAAIHCQGFAQTAGDKILGEWLSAQKDARFLIYKQGAKYDGKIVWGTGHTNYDTENPDPKLRARELIGLAILNDFVYDGDNTWTDGTIYDPKQGKTYACKLTLTGNQQLKVRGYVGISMFGRTEYWTRVKN